MNGHMKWAKNFSINVQQMTVNEQCKAICVHHWEKWSEENWSEENCDEENCDEENWSQMKKIGLISNLPLPVDQKIGLK